jgi:hypothetical protein
MTFTLVTLLSSLSHLNSQPRASLAMSTPISLLKVH